MKEYKFRGKRIDNGEWVYFNQHGAYIDKDGKELSPKRFTRDCGYAVDPETVGQYTGLQDRNGKDIYERDLLDDGESIGEVEWVAEQCAFRIYDRKYNTYFGLEGDGRLKETAVIGNIYENPELLEVESNG